ncbi:MAG: IclR family transcriptional regulator [Pontibacterium sp.]
MQAKTVKENAPNQGVKVISRAAAILRTLRDDNKGLSLGQIAEKVGLPRSTVQRIVNALLDEQLVIMTSAEGGLRLGPEIQSLASAGKMDVAEIAHPFLAELSELTGETTDLAVFRNNQMVFIDQVEGSHRLRTRSGVGEIFPLTTTANGKAALALMDEEVAATLISREIKNNEGTPRSLSEVIAEIEDVRRQGYALDIDGHTEGVSAVGSAFIGPEGSIYALSIPVPSTRFKRNQAINTERLIEATQKLKSFF